MHFSNLLPRLPAIAALEVWWLGALAAFFIAALSPVLAQPAHDRAANRRGPGQPIRILPIGDSVTHGGRTDRPEYTYRYPLYFMLRKAGYNVDFIGSRRSGTNEDAVWPDRDGVPFDPDHEAYYGGTTGYVRDRLQERIASYPVAPDIALILLGGNDIESNDPAQFIIAPLIEIIATLRTKNPSVTVLVGHLPEHDLKSRATRPLIERMAKELSTPNSPVATVHHYEGWWERPSLPWTHTFDWAHPNLRGQQKMADMWFSAMVRYLERMKHD